MLVRARTTAETLVCWSVLALSTSGTPFLGNGPESSSDIVTLLRIVPVSGTFDCSLESWCLIFSTTKHATEIRRLAHSQIYIYMQDDLCNVIEHIVQLSADFCGPDKDAFYACACIIHIHSIRIMERYVHTS